MTYLNMTDMLYTGGGSISSPDVRGNKGFTLLEMLVAIVIAGILMLVAIPTMRDWKLEQDLATKVEAVMSELDMARTSAQQMNKIVSIMPNDDSGRDWGKGFYVYSNDTFEPGRGDLPADANARANALLSSFDITDRNVRFAVGGGAQNNNNVNIRFLPNGLSGLVDDGHSNLMIVQGVVNIRLCRVIAGRAITWTIVMRSSGDTTKSSQTVAGECQGF